MFVTELFNKKMMEMPEQKQVKVIYPGRFQPFHKGHKAVYDHLCQQYGADNVYICTSNKVEPPKSPFSFDEKTKMMALTGIDLSRVVQSTQPYRAMEIVKNFDANNTILVFAISEKDMAEDPRFSFAPKKDGSPSYFQPFKDISQSAPLTQHGYMATVPTFDFKVLGQPANSATQIRAQFASADEETQKKIVTDLFGRFDPTVLKIMQDKLATVNAESVTEAVGKIEVGDRITWWYNKFHPDYKGIVRSFDGPDIIVYAPGCGQLYRLSKVDIRSHTKKKVEESFSDSRVRNLPGGDRNREIPHETKKTPEQRKAESEAKWQAIRDKIAKDKVAEGMFDRFKKQPEPQMVPLTQEQRNFIKQHFTSTNADIKWSKDGSEYVLPHNVNGQHGKGRFHFRNEDGQLKCSVEHYRNSQDMGNMQQSPITHTDHVISSPEDMEEIKNMISEGWKGALAGIALGGAVVGGIAATPPVHVDGQRYNMALGGRNMNAIPGSAKTVTADNGKQVYVWDVRVKGGQVHHLYTPVPDHKKEVKESSKHDLAAKLNDIKTTIRFKKSCLGDPRCHTKLILADLQKLQKEHDDIISQLKGTSVSESTVLKAKALTKTMHENARQGNVPVVMECIKKLMPLVESAPTQLAESIAKDVAQAVKVTDRNRDDIFEAK